MLMRASLTRNELDREILKIYRDLYAYALRLTHDKNKAEDVRQDAVLRIYRYAHLFKHDRPFVEFAFSVMKSGFFNALASDKRRYARDNHFVRYINDNQLEDANAPFKMELDEALQKLLNMPNKRGEIVYLTALGYTQEEVSVKTGVKLGTVKSSCSRGQMAARMENVK